MVLFLITKTNEGSGERNEWNFKNVPRIESHTTQSGWDDDYHRLRWPLRVFIFHSYSGLGIGILNCASDVNER